jgi:AbrB family looped-hinge helix DNA binding protein
MNTVKVLAKGQIVIPVGLRRKYEIKPGSTIQIFEYENLIYLVPPARDALRAALRCLPDHPSLSNELLNERKRDFAE